MDACSGAKFHKFCQDYDIVQWLNTSVMHPQANDEVEVTNKTCL